MIEQDRKRIRRIIGTLRRPKNCKCAEGAFENLCQAKDFGDEQRLHRLEETSPCPIAMLYDCDIKICFCQCPLRVYFAKNLSPLPTSGSIRPARNHRGLNRREGVGSASPHPADAFALHRSSASRCPDDIIGKHGVVQPVRRFSIEVLIASSDTTDTPGVHGSLLMDRIGKMVRPEMGRLTLSIRPSRWSEPSRLMESTQPDSRWPANTRAW